MRPRRVRNIQAAFALIERNGRYLICRRRAGDFLGGYWEFPGGKRKPGESWKACLQRELREELGVAVNRIRRVSDLRYRYADRAMYFKVFRCAIRQGTPKPLDARALRWVSPVALHRYRFPPANQALLDRLVVS